MNVPLPLHPAAEETASLWAARLDGSILSAEDRSALDAWLNQDSRHRELLSAYCQLSSDLERQLPALTADLVLPSGATGANVVGFRRPWKIWSAAALVAAAVAVLLVWIPSSGHQSDRFATTVGQRQERLLADGTRIDLNAHTALVVEMDRNERRVRLASGQAYFAVSHEAGRPFIVETPAGSIRVTGTQFEVRYDSSSPLEVLVVEGSVQVRDVLRDDHEAGATALAAGHHYVGGAAPSVQRLTPDAIDDALAWRRGQIVFEGVPLRDALARFARYHGRGLTASDAAGRLSIGGRFSLDDLEGFLSALEELHPVQVSTHSSGTVQVRLRSDR